MLTAMHAVSRMRAGEGGWRQSAGDHRCDARAVRHHQAASILAGIACIGPVPPRQSQPYQVSPALNHRGGVALGRGGAMPGGLRDECRQCRGAFAPGGGQAGIEGNAAPAAAVAFSRPL